MPAESEISTLWDETGMEAARVQAKPFQEADDGPLGYRLERIILTNFWLYEHQEFEIPHGRLFLAGDNRSGKSTVLTAAITLALDGNYRPERIDTFGKSEKRIDYYVIGSNESNTPYIRDQRTTYIALEFAWRGLDQPPFASELRTLWERGERKKARYLTIGVAFYGNRNSVRTITCTRFLITDGSRLEKDFSTMQTSGNGGRRACDLRTFKKYIDDHGLVCENQPEYEEKVMQYLFRFHDRNDFHRLLRQLLFLRQPNLNSILSLENVRSYLDQALPALPHELIQHAATTLQLMDTLENEIKRRQEAYTAVERLHQAQQTVCLTQIRLTACDYLYRSTQMNAAQTDVQRLKRALSRAESDLTRVQSQIDELEREQAQVDGQVKALEDSEGLQAAKKLNRAQEALDKCQTHLLAQQQLLADALERREATDQRRQTAGQTFEEMHHKSSEYLIDLHQLAKQEACWNIAAEQLATILEQLQAFSLETLTPHIAVSISSLQTLYTQERLRWLEHLKQLHQEIHQESIKLAIYQREETDASNALDAATRAFENEQEVVCQAQQDLIDRLDLLLNQSEWQSAFLPLREEASRVWNERSTPEEMVEHLGTIQKDYQREITQLLDKTKQAIKAIQFLQEPLQRQQGAQQAAIKQAWDAYEQKSREPEYTPSQAPHRALARQVLKEHGIPAFPLYMSLEVTPEGEHLAGSIEHLLEDAGLLDALVVLPEHTAAADTLLTTAGLSDCRLDLAHQVAAQRSPQLSPWGAGTLRSDLALSEIVGEQAARWQELIQTLLPLLEQTLLSPSVASSPSISWKHGLLVGQAGTGNARYLGKARRTREQQQALAQLYQHWEDLTRELQVLKDQFEQLEQQRQTLEGTRSQLEAIWQTSGVENRYAQLTTALNTLQRTDEDYRQRRLTSQNTRSHIAEIKRTLHQDTAEIPLFATAAEKVEQAANATRRLASEQQTLQNYLEQVRTAWQDYHRAQEQWHKDKAAEWRAENARRHADLEEKQASAELTTLQELVQQSEQEGDGESLIVRLQRLQERATKLPGEWQIARDRQTAAEQVRDTNLRNQDTVQMALTQAQQRVEGTQQRFLTQLGMYPVDVLLTLQAHEELQPPLELARTILASFLEMQEEAYNQQKTELEDRSRKEQHTLLTIANNVENHLHDYGPRPDEQGIIRFQNADRANAAELLTRLGEEINYQQNLLEARERELFQNFLLEELAETIGTHITDAEEWVKRMNKTLAQTAFVGSHYHLRWSPKKEEQTGGTAEHPLAHYHDLLRRQAQTFKQEEIDQLVYAFRQEIDALRAQPQTTSPTNFAEALARVFDYRNWFQFEIFIKNPDGTDIHLTNRFFKKGSGAEQYVTLYIPFFAALSALYDSAGQGVPRLIALDEAFDKVSVENTRQLLTFLAQQQFQWIMTGPSVNGEGADIPACVKYTMFCDKEHELAAGFPAFWSSTTSQEAEQ